MLYLDSADRDVLEPVLQAGLVGGVTTNPKILHQAGLGQSDQPDLYHWCVDRGASLVFLQATGTDEHDLRRSSRSLLGLGDRVRVKLVCTRAGLTVARELADEGHDVLVTAVHHPAQGLLALEVGARYIAPYVGRVADSGGDGVALIRMIRDQIDRAGEGPRLRILAASLRSLDAVASAAAAGAHDLTIGGEVLHALLEEEATAEATTEFERLALR